MKPILFFLLLLSFGCEQPDKSYKLILKKHGGWKDDYTTKELLAKDDSNAADAGYKEYRVTKATDSLFAIYADSKPMLNYYDYEILDSAGNKITIKPSEKAVKEVEKYISGKMSRMILKK